jgi:hypothetical protein
VTHAVMAAVSPRLVLDLFLIAAHSRPCATLLIALRLPTRTT